MCSRLKFFQERLESRDCDSADLRSAMKEFCIAHWQTGELHCFYFDILKFDVADGVLDRDIQIAIGS